MINLFLRYIKDSSGATAIEYGLIAVLVAIFLIAGTTLIGQNLNNSFNVVSNGFTTSR